MNITVRTNWKDYSDGTIKAEMYYVNGELNDDMILYYQNRKQKY